ncbi:MAG: ABC transporter substrate-binding protein, partial [Clostridia bacterium]|nr:ABC transporter substrate-binding protein [Clostridia bacterium]
QLEELGIKVVTLDAETIDQVLANIRTAGIITDAVSAAEELANSLEQRVKAVKEKVAVSSRMPTVFFEVWDEPLMTAGPGSFIDDLIVTAGGINVAADVGQRFAEFSLEVLLERNPDFYIINDHAHQPQDIKERPGYGGLKAVQKDQVYAITDDLVTLPGPRIIDGLEEMAKIIHPELF